MVRDERRVRQGFWLLPRLRARLAGWAILTALAAACASPAAAAAPVVFLDRAAAARAIVDDHAQPYFHTLQPMEMAAKTGRPLTARTLAAQRRETGQRYRAGVREFSEQERTVITRMVRGIDAALKHYPRLARVPWRFLKVADSIEGGLPHTRGPYIVLSQSVCEQLLGMDAALPKREAIAAAATILLHERIHVLQRSAPGLFDSLYRDVWGFVRVKSITRDPWLRRHHLANPDGSTAGRFCCWLFPLRGDGNEPVHYIWPLVVFSDGPGVKRMPQDFRMLAIDVRRRGDHARVISEPDGRPRARPLLDVAAYTRVFVISQNIYHPNEAAADLLTQLVLFDSLADTSGLSPRRRAAIDTFFQPLRHWARAHMGVRTAAH